MTAAEYWKEFDRITKETFGVGVGELTPIKSRPAQDSFDRLLRAWRILVSKDH